MKAEKPFDGMRELVEENKRLIDKLASSKAKIKELEKFKDIAMSRTECCDEEKQNLRKQLAESEAKIKELEEEAKADAETNNKQESIISEQFTKIVELKQKLAEKDALINEIRDQFNRKMDEKDKLQRDTRKTNSDLWIQNAKLIKAIGEKDKLIQELREGKPDCDDCFDKEKDKKLNEIQGYLDDAAAALKENSEQLDEKDKEIERYRNSASLIIRNRDKEIRKFKDSFEKMQEIYGESEQEIARLKKECESYTRHLKLGSPMYECCVARVQQALSELRDDVQKTDSRYLRGTEFKEKVLKAIDSRKVEG